MGIMHADEAVIDIERAEREAYSTEAQRSAALVWRAWADTGEHGWSHRARLHSLPGWHVFPGMVLPERFSADVAALGLGDVRVVGRAQSASEHRWAPWLILVESIATGERAVYRTARTTGTRCTRGRRRT